MKRTANYFDLMHTSQKIHDHFLYPSSIFVTHERFEVKTILGSCIAMCIHDPVKKSGGINHFMLPLWNGEGLASPKYGNIAINLLIDKMLGMGSEKENLIVKLFGGASLHNSNISVGVRNIQIAKDLLAKHQLNCVAESLGGKLGRKVLFDTGTGLVRMKYISNT